MSIPINSTNDRLFYNKCVSDTDDKRTNQSNCFFFFLQVSK